jgi:hypothetical protein
MTVPTRSTRLDNPVRRRSRWQFLAILLACGAALCLIARTEAGAEEAQALDISWAADGAGCGEVVLNGAFRFWQSMPDDLNQVAFVDIPTGKGLPSVLLDGNRQSMFARYILTVPPGASGKVGIRPSAGAGLEMMPGAPEPIGGNLSRLKPAALKNGDTVLGFDLELRGHGWARVLPADRLFPGGPAVERVIPLYNDPNAPILPCSLFTPNEAGGLGLRDFHVVTQPGGRTVQHEGYFYAYLMGFRLPDKPAAGRFSERALLWTRAKSLDGPWDKPKVLMAKQGPWEMIDQGSGVKVADGMFVLIFRAVVGGKRGLYVLTSRSPTGFVLPETPPPPVFDAKSLDCLAHPYDQLALPYMIKLTPESTVGSIPGTNGAFIAYFEASRWHQWRTKWHVYGAYSTHPYAQADWAPMNGGKPVLSVSDEPHSAWGEGVANPKITEVGPNQFVLGVNAYGQNLPEYKDKEDWRLWIGYSSDCQRFSVTDFHCVLSQYPGGGNHGGRIESAHWVLGPDEPWDGPLRILYFAAPYRAEPTTEFCNIYEAFGPKVDLANDLELATRSRADRCYLHRKIRADAPLVVELSASDRSVDKCRGQVFLPAILDGPDPEQASGWAVVRDETGQFQVNQIDRGLPTRCWALGDRTFVAIPALPERALWVRLALWVRESRVAKGTELLLGGGIAAFMITLGLWSRLGRRLRVFVMAMLLAGIAVAILILALPSFALRGSAAADAYDWYGPRDVQQALVRVEYDGKSLAFTVAGAQGREWLAASTPARLKEEVHVFVGKTNSIGEAVSTDLQYLLVHPPAKRLASAPQ